MKYIISLTMAATCLALSALASADTMMPTPASTGEGASTLQRDTTGPVRDQTVNPESGSTMTQQRMEEDYNHERSRDSNRRGKRYERKDNSNSPKKL